MLSYVLSVLLVTPPPFQLQVAAHTLPAAIKSHFKMNTHTLHAHIHTHLTMVLVPQFQRQGFVIGKRGSFAKIGIRRLGLFEDNTKRFVYVDEDLCNLIVVLVTPICRYDKISYSF